jgi:hypothetical protein
MNKLAIFLLGFGCGTSTMIALFAIDERVKYVDRHNYCAQVCLTAHECFVSTPGDCIGACQQGTKRINLPLPPTCEQLTSELNKKKYLW